MAVLYRPVKLKKKEKYTIEKYRGDNYHDAMKIYAARRRIRCPPFFLSFRDRLLERYDDLFGHGGQQDGIGSGFGKNEVGIRFFNIQTC